MADNDRFVVGINMTEAPDQFEINPKLQRTRAEQVEPVYRMFERKYPTISSP